MFAPAWRPWSRSRSRSGSWSGSGPWSGSGVLPPTLVLWPHATGGTARPLGLGLWAGGDHWPAFLDCLEEEGGMLRFEVGSAYYVETFGKHFVGRVADVTPTAVVLDSCAWVAETGRYHEFHRAGRAVGMEVEPVGDGWTVPLAYVSGFRRWPHPLFTEAV